MCGRYTVAASRGGFEEVFPELRGLPVDRVFAERFNVAPTQEVAALSRPEGGQVTAELMRWGLIPGWAKSPNDGPKMINAKAETLLERRSYKGLVARASGRCLVVADGFYEWAETGGRRKQPWRFTVDGGVPFAFAGLCTTWDPPDGPPLRSLTVITTEPNDLVRPVHDRMPAIFMDQKDRERWLDPQVGGEEASSLLGPADADRMKAQRVSFAVGSPRNEGPGLLIAEQAGLFED